MPPPDVNPKPGVVRRATTGYGTGAPVSVLPLGGLAWSLPTIRQRVALMPYRLDGHTHAKVERDPLTPSSRRRHITTTTAATAGSGRTLSEFGILPTSRSTALASEKKSYCIPVSVTLYLLGSFDDFW